MFNVAKSCLNPILHILVLFMFMYSCKIYVDVVIACLPLSDWYLGS